MAWSDSELAALPRMRRSIRDLRRVGACDDPEWSSRRSLPCCIIQVTRKNACSRRGQVLARSRRHFGRAAAENGACAPARLHGEVSSSARDRMTQHEPFTIPKREARRHLKSMLLRFARTILASIGAPAKANASGPSA